MRRFLKLLPLIVPVLALVLLAAAFARTMAHRAERLAGSNPVKLQQPALRVDGGSRLCQGVIAPREAASAMFYVAPTGPKGPPLAMTLSGGRRTLASSQIAGGWTGGVVRFPFRPLDASDAKATIYVRNRGSAPLAFAGLPVGAPTSATVDGKPQQALVTIEFFRPGTSTWWSLLPTIAHRAGVLKGSLAGAWAFWLAVALVLAAGAGALMIALRGLRA